MAEAKKTSVPVRVAGVEVGQNGTRRTCDVVVIPLLGASDPTGCSVRDPVRGARSGQVGDRERGNGGQRGDARATGGRLPKLENELAATKEYLQTVIAEHGRTNEDLGTANEELVSGNEELQSMNEELETAKEELQSINEELTTVNDELQIRNHEVTQVNGDLVNLLTTVDIPILILDSQRRIRRFTPKARHILNVLPTDVGRPFEDIKTNIDVADLDHQIAEVIETMTVKESEVQDREGHWYRLQIRPYKTTDNRIDGAILSLFDIDALKHLVQTAQLANADAERANHAKDEFLATLSHELRTPLSSMLMRAQMLRRGDMDEAKVKRAGEGIEAGVRMQVQLIDDLLDVSRIVTGKLSMDFQPVDLATVITRVGGRPEPGDRAEVVDARSRPRARRIDRARRWRRGPAPAGRDEPSHQRDQVHAQARDGDGVARGGRRVRGDSCEGHRNGDRCRVPAERVQSLHAGEQHEHAGLWRPRAGARDRAPPRGASPRNGHRGEPGQRHGVDVHGHPSADEDVARRRAAPEAGDRSARTWTPRCSTACEFW